MGEKKQRDVLRLICCIRTLAKEPLTVPCTQRFLSTRLTNYANDFVNAKSHARKKPLLAR